MIDQYGTWQNKFESNHVYEDSYVELEWHLGDHEWTSELKVLNLNTPEFLILFGTNAKIPDMQVLFNFLKILVPDFQVPNSDERRRP